MTERLQSSEAETADEAPEKGNATIALERMGLIAASASSEQGVPNRFAPRALQPELIGGTPPTTTLRRRPTRRVVMGGQPASQPSVQVQNRYAHRRLQPELIGGTPSAAPVERTRPTRQVVLQ